MNRIGLALALGLAGCATAGTLLTFDMKPSTTNGMALNQSYGDRVAGPDDLVGFYGTDNGTYTPNVLAAYGGSPAIWTTGYGNLTNVYYNEADTFDVSLTLTADPGYLVTLASFDLAAFGGNTTIPNLAISIRDGNGNLLFSQNGPLVISGTTRNSFSPGVSAQELALVLHVSQLAFSSDNIGIDNILFAQALDPGESGVPEPGTYSLVGAALLAALATRRRSK